METYPSVFECMKEDGIFKAMYFVSRQSKIETFGYSRWFLLKIKLLFFIKFPLHVKLIIVLNFPGLLTKFKVYSKLFQATLKLGF